MRDKRGESLPKARTEKLLVQELSGELLVYDLERDKAHCLNRTAALVWKRCDGRTGVRQITEFLQATLDAPVDDELVQLALSQLSTDHLLEEPAASLPQGMRISRRTLVRRLGIAAVLLPLVTTITAPTALAAVSCTGPCSIAAPCPPGCTCSSITNSCVVA